MKSTLIDIKVLAKKMPILNSINLNLCVSCKATQLACGLSFCPLVKAMDLYPSQEGKIETISLDGTMFGPSSQIFVGSQGYPKVLSGPMTSLNPDHELARFASKPSEWTELSFKEIIDLRFNLLRGKKETYVQPKRNIDSLNTKEKLHEVTLSVSPVEIESNFAKLSSFGFKITPDIQPMGPSGFLNSFELTSNAKIPKKVDSIIHDEINSTMQIYELYQSDYDIYYLQGLLSSGVTGLKEKSKIVPTRWSITAVDDMLGKELIPQLKHKPTINNIELRQANLLGNYYTVILMPGGFNYENIEAWMPGSVFMLSVDEANISIEREGFKKNEYYKGRTKYSKQAGGYYAARLPVLEHLVERNRQAKVLVIREITPAYLIPVGVWEVREGMRIAMRSLPILFNDKEELEKYLVEKMHYNPQIYFNMSYNFTHTSLTDFF